VIDLPTEADPVKVIEGDCLNVLPELPAGVVDCIVTDPPYGTRTDQRDEWMVGEFANVMPVALPMLHRVGTKCAALYLFTSWKWMADWVFRASPYFRMQNFIVWDKGRHSGCYGKYSWLFGWEGVFYGIKGPRPMQKSPVDLIRCPHRSEYPMEKPVDLLCQLIEATTKPGDLLLDPFLGSGSSAVAAIKTGRRLIGIEIDPKYAEIARQRVAKVLDAGLFAEVV
jgi:DNA modification methylase